MKEKEAIQLLEDSFEDYVKDLIEDNDIYNTDIDSELDNILPSYLEGNDIRLAPEIIKVVIEPDEESIFNKIDDRLEEDHLLEMFDSLFSEEIVQDLNVFYAPPSNTEKIDETKNYILENNHIVNDDMVKIDMVDFKSTYNINIDRNVVNQLDPYEILKSFSAVLKRLSSDYIKLKLHNIDIKSFMESLKRNNYDYRFNIKLQFAVYYEIYVSKEDLISILNYCLKRIGANYDYAYFEKMNQIKNVDINIVTITFREFGGSYTDESSHKNSAEFMSKIAYIVSKNIQPKILYDFTGAYREGESEGVDTTRIKLYGRILSKFIPKDQIIKGNNLLAFWK